jgi:hypothetical protein
MDGDDEDPTQKEPFDKCTNNTEDPVGDLIKRFLAFIKETIARAEPGEKLAFTSNLALIAVGIIAAGIYGCQLSQMRKATIASQQSTSAIVMQTDITERPWLSVEVEPASDLFFVGGQQPNFNLKLKIKNFGRSIAKDAQVDIRLAPTRPSGVLIAPEAGVIQNQVCERPVIQKIGRFDVFPSDAPAVREVSISAMPAQVQTAEVVTTDNRTFVGLYVVGCVTYRASYDARQTHQTFFGYHLIHPIPGGPNRPTLPNGLFLLGDFEIGANVPQKEFEIAQELFARNEAE